jgi:hypothetical protein
MNKPYDLARYKMLTAAFDWTAMELRLAAWGGTPDFVPADQQISDINARPANAMLGYSQEITEHTVSPDGTAQTNQVIIPDVPVGQAVTWFTLVRFAAVPADSELILFIDDAIELPFDPNGLDIVVNPDWLSQRGWFRP